MKNFKNDKGSIELICGPMFSGKTEDLLRKINRASYANLDTVIFKPVVDSRTRNVIKTRSSKDSKKAIEIANPYDIFKHLRELKNSPRIIAIDEVQFFDMEIVDVVNTLANGGFTVIASGLDLDFRGEPFPIISKLICLAETVTKLSAICTKCGEPGTITQRYIDNKPANYSSPIILIGNTESYTVRCRQCHEVIGKEITSKAVDFLKWKKSID